MALPRYRRAAVAAIAVGMLALTACGSKSPQDVTANPSGQGQIGDAPGASATATASSPAATTTTPSNGGGGGGTTNPSPYPNNAKDYGLEILKAIADNDDARIVDLSSLNTAQYVQQQNYKSKNGQWTHTDCQSGSTQYCHYYNQTGDIAAVGIESAKLGTKGAGSSVAIEGSTFPMGASGYVQSFVYHWQNGNYAGMVAYSNTNVANYAKSKTPPSVGFTSQQPWDCGGGKKCIDAASAVAAGTGVGTIFHFVIDLSKIGKPNAITGYLPETAGGFHN